MQSFTIVSSDTSSDHNLFNSYGSNYIPGMDPQMERDLERRMDIHVLPLCTLLYTCFLLIRNNMHNAASNGLFETTDINEQQYQVISIIFYVPYILLGVPSAVCIQRFGASRYLSILSLSTGIVGMVTAGVKSYGGFVACRVFLGITQSGVLPGLAAYLSMLYTRNEMALRLGMLFVCFALSGSFGGLLSVGISHLSDYAGLYGWQWIMILEGLPSIISGIVAWLYLPDNVAVAKFMTREERSVMMKRRRVEYGQTRSAQVFSNADARRALSDWKLWLMGLSQIGASMGMNSYGSVLPMVIQKLGNWDDRHVQLISAPCFLFAALAFLIIATFSDYIQRRGIFVVVTGVVCVIGYIVIILPVPPAAKYVGMFMIGTGDYVVIGISIAWIAGNTPRFGKRTVGIAMASSMGNIASVCTPFIYNDRLSPETSHAIVMVCVMCSVGVSVYMMHHLANINLHRMEDGLETKYRTWTEEELEELGDSGPRFRYQT